MSEQRVSPLEAFFRSYVETSGGLWDEVEPQVYDVLWMDEQEEPERITFDPEALPEHPTAHLMTFGLPLLDTMLTAAQARGEAATAYLDGSYQEPYGIAGQVPRDLTLPDGVRLEVERVRSRYVLHTLFWFEATYLSDEKEQVLLTAVVDRFYGRLVRHLEPLDWEALGSERLWPFPDAPVCPLDAAYEQARERVVRNVVVAANAHQRERRERMERQVAQMGQYFTDMRAEVQERMAKARARGEETATLEGRLESLERERVMRIDEVRRKAVTRCSLQLVTMLHLFIPRLCVESRLVAESRRAGASSQPLLVTWDAMTGTTDAVDCPTCGTPTYVLRAAPRGGYGCPMCQG